jgi:4-amino-4-deoxy-L-arabinose transferase-like glycosyltransferase
MWIVALARLLLTLIAAPRYGWFGDELYFLACAEHLDWGYVDQPPLWPFVMWIVRHTLGASVVAIHIVPALAGAAKVLLAGYLARELGGGKFAQFLAALCVAAGPVFLVLDHLATMNTLEPLMWTACGLIVARIINGGNQRLWLWFGLIAGLGLENKYSMAVFGLGVVIGLIATAQRKAFAQKWIWLAGAIAFAVFLPNLIWNVQHHWPFIELMHNIGSSGRDIRLNPIAYVVQQILMLNPLTAPVWIAGAIWLFTTKKYRVLGWTFVVVFAFFFLTRSKEYYTAPVYPIAFAGGAVALEAWMVRTWMRTAYAAAIIIVGLLLMPFALPILPIETYVRYQKMIPIPIQADERSHVGDLLPHHYAWTFGWEELVAAVARAYNSLPPAERARTAIIGNNFGECGAVDLLGAKYGLPKSIGVHQNYWLWGPRHYDGSTVIILGDTPEGASQWFRDVEVVPTGHNRYAQRYENKDVLLCRGPKVGTLQQIWPRIKNWD